MAPHASDPPNDFVVVLMGFDPHFVDPQGRSAVERLQEAFGIEFNLARHFVDNVPVVVKRHCSPTAARKYEVMLGRIGAFVDLRREGDDPGSSRGRRPADAGHAAPTERIGSTSDLGPIGGASPIGTPSQLGRIADPVQPQRRAERPAAAVHIPKPRGSEVAPASTLAEDIAFADDGDIFSSKPQDVVRRGYTEDAVQFTAAETYGEDIGFADDDVPATGARDILGAETSPERAPTEKACPKCHFEQPATNVECDRCGIVFSKWLATHAEVARELHNAEVAAATGQQAPAAIVGVISRGAPQERDAGHGGAHGLPNVPPGRPGTLEKEPQGFWASIPRAFAVPIWGKGLIWQTILIGVLLGTSCMAAMPGCILKLIATFLGTFLFFGLLGRYFQSAAQVGLEGELRGPDLPFGGDFGDLKSEIILPGIAYFLLAIVLFLFPFFTMVGAARDNAFEQHEMGGQWKIVEEGKVVSSTDTMLLIDPENNPIYLDKVDGVVEARTTDQRQVRVITSNHHLVFYDASGQALDALETPNPQESPIPSWTLLTLLVPLVLWPMCLIVSIIDGSLLSLFNPFRVLPAIFKGGIPYLTVVVLGVVVSFGCSFLSTLLVSAGGMGMASGGLGSLGGFGVLLLGMLVGLGSFSYVTGVQAYLMGRLAATRPHMLSHLNN